MTAPRNARRTWLAALGLSAFGLPLRAAADGGADRGAEVGAAAVRLAAAWAEADGTQWLGVLEPDADSPRVRLAWRQRLPGRAHGLLALADGGVAILANRPGRWLCRFDREGALQARAQRATDDPFVLGGHAVLTADGTQLLCTASDLRDHSGHIEIRDTASLALVDRLPSGGIEPHHLVLDPADPGALWIAHGGIRRDAGDRKLALDAMASRLTLLSLADGAARHWRLADPRLSLRHLAVLADAEGAHGAHRADIAPWIGVALQAEHDDAAQRQAAPTLAVLAPDRERLDLPAGQGNMAGYAGDIAVAGGRFLLSSSRAHRAMAWGPQHGIGVAAELRQAGALASAAAAPDSFPTAAWLAAERGLGRWHPAEAGRLWAWPAPLALDNHWCVLNG